METGVDLCCGLAGRAYALLALHRASGDDIWLREARALAVRALRPRVANDLFQTRVSRNGGNFVWRTARFR
jgi:hypothetical protein